MKGTRPRHPDPTQDRALVEELFRSEKDRAENTMIVDMSRNDLSRIARPGTVKVPRMHHIETYPTVHQMVSSVTAETDSSLMEVLSAAFPAASITGAPKVATTRIIASLEQEARGVYTGAIGHVAPGGSFELNVAIRTAWVDRRKGTVVYGVGGGIVWDSDPAAEWREAMAKARILARAESDLRLLESMAWNPEGGVFLLDRHIERLERTAAHFGFRIDAEEVRRLLDTQRAQTPCSLRLLVDPDGTLELLSSDLPAPFDETVHVVFDDRPVESGDEFLAHKTTRRHRYDEARMRRPDVFDVVLWNERGEVTESTIANVVVEVDGAFVTPPTTSGLLPGTLRAELLATGRIAERVLTPSEMERATRVWLINSVRGWIPIQIDWTTKPRLPISSPQPPVPTPDSGLPPPKSQVPSLKFQS
jgi:para-aminobenzoate synthetase/4-amino-4-deoxychorismate lyase